MDKELIKSTRVYDMADVYILNGEVLKNRQGSKKNVDLRISRDDKRIIVKQNNDMLEITISKNNHKNEILEYELDLIEKRFGDSVKIFVYKITRNLTVLVESSVPLEAKDIYRINKEVKGNIYKRKVYVNHIR